MSELRALKYELKALKYEPKALKHELKPPKCGRQIESNMEANEVRWVVIVDCVGFSFRSLRCY